MAFDSSGWSGHFPLTSKSSAITALPTHVLIDLSIIPGTDDWWDEVQADGDDIRIEDESGNEVEYKLVPGTFNSTSHTGELLVDIATFTSLSTSVNKTWKIHAGNAGASAPSYTPFSPTGSPKALLSLGESPVASAPEFIDATGNGYSGTADGGTYNGSSGGTMDGANAIAGKIGNGIDFINNGDRILVPLGTALQAIGTGDFTILFWALIDDTGRKDLMIWKTSDTNYDLALITTATDAKVLCAAKIAGGDYNSVTGSTSLSTVTWYKVGVRRLSGNVQVVVNGALEGTPLDLSGYDFADNTQSNVWLGQNFDASYAYATNRLDGSLDQFEFYDRALSADELATDYANQAAADGIWTAGTWTSNAVVPTFRSSETASAATASEVTITKPVGLSEGDLLLCLIGWQEASSGALINTPSGWTDLGSVTGSGNNNTEVFYKIADSGDVAATNFTFSNGGTNVDYINGILAAYSDVDAVYPIDASLFAEDNENGSGTVTVGGITTTNDNCVVVIAAETNANSGETWTTTPPTGFTLRDFATQPNSGDIIAFDKLFATAGATGDIVLNHEGTGNYSTVTSIVLALNPAGVNPPPMVAPLIATASVVTAPTVVPGVVSLTVPLVATAPVVTAPSVVAGAASITVPAIATESTVTPPSVSIGAVSLTVPIISSGVVVTAPDVVIEPFSLTVPLVSSAVTVNPPTVIPGAASVTVPLIATASVVTAPSLVAELDQTFTVPLIATSSVVTAPTLVPGVVSLTVPAIATSSAVIAPTLVPGAAALVVPAITTGSSVTPPSLVPGAATLTVPVIATGSTVTAPSVGQRISVPVITPGVAVTAPTVTPGALTVTVPAISTESAVTPPALVPGEVTFTVPDIATSSVVIAPTLVPGAVSLTAPTIATASTLTAPALSPGAVTLTVPTISTSVVVTAPDLVPGVATLTAPLITTTSTLTAPSVGQRQSVPLISTVSTVTSPKVNQSMYVPVIVTRLGFRRVLITNNGVTDPARTRPSIDVVVLDRRTTAVKLRSR